MIEYKNQKYDKFAAAIIGAAVGDALGWPNEQGGRNLKKDNPMNKELFQKWTRKVGYKTWAHIEEILPGEYSDDTQLIISTARSLNFGSSWNKYFTKVELPAWLSYERGGGGATKRAAQSWKRGSNPWNLDKEKKTDVKKYFDAGGNGVAMRILPHVFKNDNNWDEISHQVFLNGIYTHGHPRALVGALIYADALFYLLSNENTLGYGELVDYLLNRKNIWGTFPGVQKIENWMSAAEKVLDIDYMKIWSHVTDEAVELLEIAQQGLTLGALDMGNEVLEKLGCFDKKVNGAGTISAVAAIYLASKYASSPHLGIIEASFLTNADTDTLSSMVGGLLGILHGSNFITSSWQNVQDYEYIRSLIYINKKNDEISSGPILDFQNDNFKLKLKELSVGDSILAQPFGVLTLRERRLNNSNLNGAVVNTLKLTSALGQNIYIKTFENKHEENTPLLRNINISQGLELERNSNLIVTQNTMIKSNKISIDSIKLRNLANILPLKLDFNLCLQFIADIMDEIERTGNKKLDHDSIQYICKHWEKYQISIKEIEKVLYAILNY